MQLAYRYDDYLIGYTVITTPSCVGVLHSVAVAKSGSVSIRLGGVCQDVSRSELVCMVRLV